MYCYALTSKIENVLILNFKTSGEIEPMFRDTVLPEFREIRKRTDLHLPVADLRLGPQKQSAALSLPPPLRLLLYPTSLNRQASLVYPTAVLTQYTPSVER